MELTCFKAYDVRGELGVNIDADICYRIGRSFAQSLNAKTIVVGRDARETSPELVMLYPTGSGMRAPMFWTLVCLEQKKCIGPQPNLRPVVVSK